MAALVGAFLVAFACQGLAYAEEAPGAVPPRYGIALQGGNTFSPDGSRTFALASFIAQYDYDAVWPHPAPDNLRWKLELAAGSTVRPDVKAMLSANMFAVYYLETLRTPGGLTPYAELGIGGMYSDFKFEGQGSRFNFNPQLGVGVEFPWDGNLCFTALRLHHLSNAGLVEDNKGVNSFVLTAGFFF